jgi:hypothetical protein
MEFVALALFVKPGANHPNISMAIKAKTMVLIFINFKLNNASPLLF